MRRKEREVTDITKIKAIIGKCFSIHIGFNDDGHVYVVPVNFGCKEENGKYTFYFHGARDGRKYGLIQKGGLVGFELDCNNSILKADTACAHSAFYSSVIGEGNVSEITDNDDKKTALNLIMKQATGRGDWNYPSVMLNRVGVFKIDVTELSCKEHLM